MIALASSHFDKVIALINSFNVMELGELESNPDVDAIVWVGSPGQTGFYAVGDVLCGNVNPSGRTADIYPADLTQDPTFVNFGSYQYSNISAANAFGDAYFVQYEEGTYVGYRYYETAAVEGFLDYSEAVIYPFGYGLSYTSFDWTVSNQELGDVAYEMGLMVGNEGLTNHVNAWYAPAVNLHRSPFAGRNFEYYSENGLLSGKMAAAVISGTAEKGLLTYAKHYVANEQETNRVNNGLATWVNEQALRELYLKPFIYIVKNSSQNLRHISDESGIMVQSDMNAAIAFMSSFNRIGATWAGGSTALMQTILREERGFQGAVVTDFVLYDYMSPDQAIAAGSDLILSTDAMKSLQDSSSASAVQHLRKATHNILFAVAHSSAMNNIAPGTIITYTTAPWVTTLMIADGIIALFLCAAIAWIILRIRKHKKPNS